MWTLRRAKPAPIGATTRFERREGSRVLSVLLIAIGLIALAAICYMTGRFGWSLQEGDADRTASAVIHVKQEKSLSWQRGVSIQRDVPRSERLYLRKKTRAAQERLEKTLAIIPDAPAQSIADLLSTTVLRVQRALVMIASCVGQIIMQSCLFIGFFV
jgi:hypothetical protein